MFIKRYCLIFLSFFLCFSYLFLGGGVEATPSMDVPCGYTSILSRLSCINIPRRTGSEYFDSHVFRISNVTDDGSWRGMPHFLARNKIPSNLDCPRG